MYSSAGQREDLKRTEPVMAGVNAMVFVQLLFTFVYWQIVLGPDI